LIKLQANANSINPLIKNVFSLRLKFIVALRKRKYIKIIVTTNNGITLDDIKINRNLNLFSSIKYLIPIKAFKDSIEEICKG
jgi:hypothetical protein